MEMNLSTMYYCYLQKWYKYQNYACLQKTTFSEVIYGKTNRERLCKRLKMCKKGFIAFYENNNTRNAFNATL